MTDSSGEGVLHCEKNGRCDEGNVAKVMIRVPGGIWESWWEYDLMISPDWNSIGSTQICGVGLPDFIHMGDELAGVCTVHGSWEYQHDYDGDGGVEMGDFVAFGGIWTHCCQNYLYGK